MGKLLRLGLLLVAAMAALTSCGGSGSTKTTPPSAVTINITSAPSNVVVGTSATFTAAVTGSTNMAVTWQVTGGANNGTITSTGTSAGIATASYTAPANVPSPATVTITAISQANTAKTTTAKVTIGPDVVVSPTGTTNSPFTVQTFSSQQFVVTVTGTSNKAVTWTISCTAGGSACGAISNTGFYKAPNSVPTTAQGGGSVEDTVTVSAVPQASNQNFAGSSIVAVTSLNQQSQPPPVKLGTSGSNVNALCPPSGNSPGFCFGGTLGSLISRAGLQFILSNNHVLGLSDGGTVTSSKTPGDGVIQPALIENGCSAAGTTTVGHLTQFVNLQPPPAVPVDAAIAQVVAGTVDITGSIEELGSTVTNGVPDDGPPASGPGTAAAVSMPVAKSGRTTGLTCSTVVAIKVSNVRVMYQKGCSTAMFTITYSNQIVVGGGAFSAEGDSGSLIVNSSTAQPVALLFAGDSSSTVGNPVSDVLTALKDSKGNKPTFVGGTPHAVAACSLPPPTSAKVTQAAPALSTEVVQRATAVRDRHSVELLANPAVAAIGVGPSLDSPNEAAVLVFVQKGVTRNPVPAELEGVRTRIMERENFPMRGTLSGEQSAQLVAEAEHEQAISLADSEVQRAIAIQQKHLERLSSDPAVQGVGVAASMDSPGEAALILYVLKGKTHNPIPATIDGLRTRIKETTGFRAGVSRPVNGKGQVCSALAPAPAVPQDSNKKSHP